MHNNSRRTLSVGTRRPGVVFMVPGFPANEADSSCLPAVQNYVAELCALRPDLEVHVIAFQYPYESGEYRWHDATVHALGGRNRVRWRRVPTWARATRLFLRLRKGVDVKVLHTFWLTDCTAIGHWLARPFGTRHVASIGGRDAQPSNRYLRRLNLRAFTVTAGSRFAAEVFAANSGAPPARVIPLGLDTTHLETIRDSDASVERDIDLIGVGSLIPLKDYSAFLDLIVALKDEFPRIKSCIVGGGPEHEMLSARIRREGLQENVALTGHLPRDEVFRRLLRSRIFLHTSDYESQGYVFLEALFAGLHVVCFDVGFLGDGEHVSRCDSHAGMLEACRRLMREPPLPDRHPVPTVEDTVRAFEDIYGI